MCGACMIVAGGAWACEATVQSLLPVRGGFVGFFRMAPRRPVADLSNGLKTKLIHRSGGVWKSQQLL